MFVFARTKVLRSALQRAAITPLRTAKPHGYQGSWYSSKPSSKLDQLGMGQSDKGRKDQSKGLILGVHPVALISAITIVFCGYHLLIKPAFEAKASQPDRPKIVERKIEFSDAEIARFPFDQKTVVFVLGGPGSGKGTNSAKLVDDFGFVHLSAGDLLREEQARPAAQFGELIEYYIREGKIVPHEVTIGLLRNAMMKHPECDRFLIDGFPRNLKQAKAFEDTVCVAKKVLYFECPESVLLERLLDRGKTSGRSDDNIESIKKRFRTYVNDSKPVIDDYDKQGKVITVSCKGTMDSVYDITKKQMAAFLEEAEKEQTQQQQKEQQQPIAG
ncbi:bifunctional uridylate/adenylate kinase [Coemansia sp. RSA 1813]|nr:bifunctional uridylate/adenylate kinase [Coemansia sp. RSA 1646]KAJ1771172.1 bifunctional uridylate/adenylate kinase [Coemansia sp. RSA 1843]KAJ2087804.1 bifunctional uridylate/adenylate kinase [Coemansia sp. RSA 986]KAJ2212698.1 bifunctional uridylate/adenylate kinase [Coemansia sp. RSA 487]KAJ2567377.1 bifunctional uridylate/adenylate kinase [Coemansia sp. RSA 1813]